jgi:hypothetical protein
MKLYAFQPKGHGELSFFVMAESEDEAKQAVESYIKSEEAKGRILDYDQWGTDYYMMTVLEAGEVIENDND